MRISHLAATLAAPLLLALPCSAQAVQVDKKLPDYEPVQGVSGTIKSVGSDTMNNLMALWGDGFKKFYP
ncbi:MAG: phosphate-binding protein, partial [Planctomycetota bacterium]